MARTVVRRNARSSRAPQDAEQDGYEGTEDTEEDETPRRSRRRRADTEDRPARSRSRSRDEVEDRPGRSPTRRTSKRGSAQRRGGRGWGAVAEARKEETNFPDRYKVDKEKILTKFLENEPFDTYWVHWLNELPKGTKKSWICIATDSKGTGCPLCEIGDQPAYRAAFNVVDLTSEREPQIKIWEATPDPRQQIESAQEDWGDLSVEDMYFVVSKKKQGNGRYAYKVEHISADDLDKRFGVDPLTDDELDEFELYTEDATESPSVEDLEEIAEMLED